MGGGGESVNEEFGGVGIDDDDGGGGVFFSKEVTVCGAMFSCSFEVGTDGVVDFSIFVVLPPHSLMMSSTLGFSCPMKYKIFSTHLANTSPSNSGR